MSTSSPERIAQVELRGVPLLAVEEHLLAIAQSDLYFIAMEQPAPVGSRLTMRQGESRMRMAQVARVVEIAAAQKTEGGPTKPGCYFRWIDAD